MLRKILKYDLRAMARASFPLFLSSGIIAIVCCALMFFTLNFSEAKNIFVALTLVTGFYLLGIVAILSMLVVNFFFVISRYYKSLFSDEGYLNMVIPTGTATLLSAKMLSTFIWLTVSGAVASLALALATAAPVLLYDPGMITDAISFFLEIGISPDAFGRSSFIFDNILLAVFTSIESISIVLTAVTIGSVIMRRHKVFGSVLFFFFINFIHSIIMGVVELVISLTLGEGTYYIFYTVIIEIAVAILFSAGMCLLNYYFLKHKFNIE